MVGVEFLTAGLSSFFWNRGLRPHASYLPYLLRCYSHGLEQFVVRLDVAKL
jgi:hypothetical protein